MSEDRDRPSEAYRTDLSDRELAAIQEARADYSAGRYYTHEQILRWLRTWGTDHEIDGPQ